MFTSGSSKLVKGLNRQHIINLVRMNSSISAREISNITGLQISTVLYTLKKFEEKGYIRRIGMGGTTIQGGKPPVLWDIASDYGFTFGVELLSKEISLVLLDFKSEVIFQRTYEIEYTQDPEKIADQIKTIVDTVVREFKVPKKKILGLGLAMPGIVDCKKGRILYSMGFDLHSINFKEILEARFDFDIEIENDEEQEETQVPVDKDVKKSRKKSLSRKKDKDAEKIQELGLKLEEMNDKYLRLFSEFDNFRKRTLKERLELFKTASEDVMVSLLPIVDDFERALKATEENGADANHKEGIELIYNKFIITLKQKGLESLDSMGQEFDTDFHEAITNIPAPSPDLKGKVVDVIEKGYKLNDKVIRFAKVVVGN